MLVLEAHMIEVNLRHSVVMRLIDYSSGSLGIKLRNPVDIDIFISIRRPHLAFLEYGTLIFLHMHMSGGNQTLFPVAIFLYIKVVPVSVQKLCQKILIIHYFFLIITAI